jgi:hypothetical protein
MNVRLIAAIAGYLIVGAGSAYAADPKLDAALKTFSAVAADPAKFQTYCQMTAAMASTENATDQTQTQDVDQKIEGFIKILGPDFSAAMDLEENLDPNSADGKTYSNAVDGLDAKCPK